MKSNTKSSITLPAHELRLVQSLKARLRLKSNVEVVRKGLLLLQQTTDRAALKEALANEMSYSASVFMSEDAKEGIEAFKEKRPPVWRGR